MTVAEAEPAVDFSLTEDQELLRETVRRFAEERIAPGEAERDREHRFPEGIVAELAELGLLGMLVPEEHGGAGLDPLTYAIAIEELSRISAAVGVTVTAVAVWRMRRHGGLSLRVGQR